MSAIATYAIEPFPGLRPFEPEHSALFFGRDEQTDELLRRLQSARFLAVVGDSGSGKSSLVRAGLIPALQRGYMADAGSRWQIALFRPGDDPVGHLAQALHRSGKAGEGRPDAQAIRKILERNSMGLVQAATAVQPDKHNMLVVVDQFEEIFRYKRETVRKDGGDSAAAFVKLLLTASQEENSTVYVVLTMRSDFLGECAQFRGLPEALNGGQYLVPRLTREQKREVIEGPAAVADAEFAPMLVQRLLNDVGDKPDQLPILQHALMRTWEESAASRERGEPINPDHYEAVGGIGQALNRHVESAYQELEDEDREIAKKIFQRLTERSNGDREIRRPTRVAELCAVTGAEQERVINVINKFRETGRTFLTSPDAEDLNANSVIDITHESLIRLWETLRDWVAEEADSARMYRRLAESAVEGRAAYHDQDLKQALSWQKQTRPNRAWAERYNPAFDYAMKFLDVSHKLQHGRARKKTAAIAGLCILTVVAVISAIRISIKDGEVAARELLAQAQRLQAAPGPALQTSALLAIESLRRKTLFENDLVLREAIGLLPRPVSTLQHESGVRILAFSDDGNMLATASDNGAVRVFETLSGKQLARINGQGHISSIAFSSGGGRLAIGNSGPAVLVFEAATGKQMAALNHGAAVCCVVFTPDSRRIITAGTDGGARLFDADTGTEIWISQQGGAVNGLAVSPDGERLATANSDGTARVIASATGKQIAQFQHAGQVRAVAFSPNGLLLATISAEQQSSDGPGAARIFEVGTGRETAHMLYQSPVNAIAFSPDSSKVVAGGEDGTARVFDVRSGNEFSRLNHGGPVVGVAFSRDGLWVATASSDSTGRVFEVVGGKEIARLIHQDKVQAVAFSPDGRRVATGSNDRTVRVFAAGSGNVISRVAHSSPVLSVAFNPATGRVLTGDREGLIRVLQLDTGREIAHLSHQGGINTLIFSGDASLAAAGTDDGHALILESATGHELAHIDHESPVLALAFSGDNSRVAIGGMDGLLRVCEARSGREVFHANVGTLPLRAVSFSPDGQRVIVGGDDRMAHVLETVGGRELSHYAHQKAVRYVAFSPKGGLVLSGSSDGIAALFEADTGKELQRITSEGEVNAVAFSHDGGLFAIGSSIKASAGPPGGMTRIFDTASGREMAHMIHARPARDVIFSSDDRLVAAAGEDHLIHVFRALDGTRMALISGDFIKAMRFTEDGVELQVVSTEAMGARESNVVSIERHLLRAQDLISEGCSRLTRNLNAGEWKSFFDRQAYRKICMELP